MQLLVPATCSRKMACFNKIPGKVFSSYHRPCPISPSHVTSAIKWTSLTYAERNAATWTTCTTVQALQHAHCCKIPAQGRHVRNFQYHASDFAALHKVPIQLRTDLPEKWADAFQGNTFMAFCSTCAMVKASYKGTIWGSYRTLIKGLPFCI